MNSKIDATGAELKLGKVLTQTDEQSRAILLQFAVYMMDKTGQTFRQLKNGGTYRGVTWKPFRPQYTRKTDGVTVPAWGGVARLNGKGFVLGRKRPSGQRVSTTSNLMRDTGVMAAAAGNTWRFTNGNHRIWMETKGPSSRYAAEQQAMRRFLFFNVPEDRDQFKAIAKKVLNP